MPTKVRPTVLWMPNVELFMLLANLTEEGARFQPKAVNPLRRAAWLRFDDFHRAPAVVETGRLLRDGFWLDSLVELALAAEPLPKSGFAYGLSRETVERAANDAGEGLSRLSRYLEYAAAFTLDSEAQDFLKLNGEAYRTAVTHLEDSLGEAEWTQSLEAYFGLGLRSCLSVASLLMPAGFSFGTSLFTPEGILAVAAAGPFIEPDGHLTFHAPIQATNCMEREMTRALLKPVLSKGQLKAAQGFARPYQRGADSFAALGYREPLTCLEDHLVFAIQARLMIRRGERATAEALLRFDQDSGFTFIRPLAEALEDYELHRADYPTFDAFFPHLMDAFAAV